MTEPAHVQWLRTQLPHGWLIVSPEVVEAMRRLMVAYRADMNGDYESVDLYENQPIGQFLNDLAVVASTFGVK